MIRLTYGAVWYILCLFMYIFFFTFIYLSIRRFYTRLRVYVHGNHDKRQRVHDVTPSAHDGQSPPFAPYRKECKTQLQFAIS